MVMVLKDKTKEKYMFVSVRLPKIESCLFICCSVVKVVQDIQPTCIARVLPGVEQNRVNQIHYPVSNAAFVQIGVAGNAVGRFRAMMQHVPMPVHELMLVVLVNAFVFRNISSTCISIRNQHMHQHSQQSAVKYLFVPNRVLSLPLNVTKADKPPDITNFSWPGM